MTVLYKLLFESWGEQNKHLSYLMELMLWQSGWQGQIKYYQRSNVIKMHENIKDYDSAIKETVL